MTQPQPDPTFSILMPVYNCEAYIGEAIESIINQTLSDWELIILDDGSTDRTEDIVNQYTDKRIRFISNEPRMGVANARNRLIRSARGELITWLDADDTSHPPRLEKLLDAFTHDTELSICGSNVIRYLAFSGECVVSNYPTSHSDILETITQKRVVPFTGASVAFRREILEEITGFRTFFNFGGEDPDFILRVCEKYKVGNLPNILYLNRYTRSSVSRSYDNIGGLKLSSSKITFFLFDQRQRYDGVDALMDGGNRSEFDGFLEAIKHEFEQDKSLVFRRACLTKISNQDYWYALLDACSAIKLSPLATSNYVLLGRIVGSCAKTLSRILYRRIKKVPTCDKVTG